MVTVKTADGDFEVRKERVHAPKEPGLGVTPRLDVLGNPVASYS
jgi:L-alanine-DL-glutamate epimerase-like enolase superfamily enzyme